MHHVDIVGTPSPIREMQGPIQTEPGTLAPIDPLTDPRYDDFVAGCQQAGAYHAGAWARILTSAYGGRPHYLALTGADGTLEAALPLVASRGVVSGTRLRSLPVVPHSGPVGRSIEAEAALIAAACRIADERGATLTINSRTAGYAEHVPGLVGNTKNPTWVTLLPPDADGLRSGWKKGSNNLFRNIAKSEKAGVRVREGQGDSDLRDFYRLYLATMRRHRSLPRAWRQMKLDQALLGPSGVFRLFIAEHESRPVAAAIFHAYGDTVDLLYNGSDEAARDLRPNFALYWHAISWAIEHGFRHFDWGEAQEGGPLSRFKAQWSADPVADYRYDYSPGGEPGGSRADRLRNTHDLFDTPGERSRRERVIDAVWERTPLTLTRAAGSVVYRLF
ncbi:MAG TPA: GNAT family N-acetyltransferase [Thermoleophilaceae bacterium]